MDSNEAMQLALGYAWAAEDYSKVTTAPSPSGTLGFLAFAEAFTYGYAELNAEKRTHMISVQDAYKAWQASGGKTIERDEVEA